MAFRPFLSGAAGAALAITIGLPVDRVEAQESSSNALLLEEVVVTARRREEALQSTPLAVSAFTDAEMDLRGHLNIVDIATQTPNVSIEQAAATGGLTAAPTVFIRGIGQADFVINTDPAVGIYVDGVYTARSIGGLMDLIDLERAEVLRGPQGTLFGRNSLAGAVNLVTKRPTTEGFDADLRVAAGSDEYVELGGALNFRITDDAAARVSFLHREREGYIQAVNYDDFWLGAEDTQGVRAQLEFTPGDKWRINLTGDYMNLDTSPSPFRANTIGSSMGDKTNAVVAPFDMGAQWWNIGTPMGGPSLSGDPTCTTQDGRLNNPACHGQAVNPANQFETGAMWYDEDGNLVRPTQELAVEGLALTTEYDAGPGVLKLILAGRGFESDFTNDNDFGPHAIFNNVNEDFHQDQTSAELQFVGNAGDQWDYTVGLYSFEETGTEIVTLVGAQGLVVTMGSSGQVFQSIKRDIDNTSDAIYGQATYHFNAPLHLTVGVRVSDDSKGFDVTTYRDFCTAPGNTANGDGILEHSGAVDICQSADGQAGWTETDPMVTLAWDVADQTMLYGTYATGFRDGGFASRFPQGLPDPIPAFEPEYVESFEVGVKSTLADGRFRINAALFMTDYDDLQVAAQPIDLSFGGTGVNNVGKASMDGLEVEAFWSVTDNFRLDATLGYLDASIDELVGGELISGNYTITEDATLPYTPELNYTLGLTWRAPLRNGADITTRVDWMHTDDFVFRIEPNPDLSQPSYSHGNIHVGYTAASGAWNVTLGVRNFTDEVWSTAGTFSEIASSTSRNLNRPRWGFLRYQYFLNP